MDLKNEPNFLSQGKKNERKFKNAIVQKNERYFLGLFFILIAAS